MEFRAAVTCRLLHRARDRVLCGFSEYMTVERTDIAELVDKLRELKRFAEATFFFHVSAVCFRDFVLMRLDI